MPTADFYQTLIVDRATRPQHFGVLVEPDVTVTQRDDLANDELSLAIKYDSTKQQIIEARWQGEGCLVSRAVMESITDQVLRLRELDKLRRVKLVDILVPLGLEQITPSRFKCVNLGWQVFQAVLDKLNQNP